MASMSTSAMNSDGSDISNLASPDEVKQKLVESIRTGHGEAENLLFSWIASKNINQRINEDGCTALHYAIVCGRVELVRLLLQNGADTECLTTKWFSSKVNTAMWAHKASTPLMLAVKTTSLEIVKMLIETGAEVNKINVNSGATAILLACGFESGWSSGKVDPEIVRYLLENGATINTKSWEGQTPLIEAVQGHYKEVVELLIKRGAKVNEKNNNGDTAILLACGYVEDEEEDDYYREDDGKVNPEISKILLENGATVDCNSKGGRTAFVSAVRGFHKEVVKLLIEQGAVVNETNNRYGVAALLLACGWYPEYLDESAKVDPEMVKLLLENGAAVDSKDKKGWTPLMYAVKGAHREVAQLLIENGADVNDRASCGDKAIDEFCDGWGPEVAQVVNFFLGAGATEKCKDCKDNGVRAILMACGWATDPRYESGKVDPDIVRLLIEQGAHVNCKDESGSTPLMWAVQRGHADLVQLLLENGADVHEKNNYCDTVLDWSCCDRADNIDAKIVRLLLKHGATVTNVDDSNLLTWATRRAYKEVVEAFLEKGANVNLPDSDGNSALLLACGCWYNKPEVTDEFDPEIAPLLLDSGATVDSEDSDGLTPLMWAAKLGHKELVEQLIRRGANIKAKNMEGKTALEVAKDKSDLYMCRTMKKKYEELIEFLQSAQEKPRSLQSFCRLAIRAYCVTVGEEKGKTIYQSVQGLNDLLLPKPIKNYLMYRN